MIEADGEHRGAATERNGKGFSDKEIVGISVGFLVNELSRCLPSLIYWH